MQELHRRALTSLSAALARLRLEGAARGEVREVMFAAKLTVLNMRMPFSVACALTLTSILLKSHFRPKFVFAELGMVCEVAPNKSDSATFVHRLLRLSWRLQALHSTWWLTR